jgi:hypothetical protein
MSKDQGRLRRHAGIAIVTIGVGALTASLALAATVPIDGTVLTANTGTVTWDADPSFGGCLGSAYTPVDDGVLGAQDDAFDGGLAIRVGLANTTGTLTPFTDTDGNGQTGSAGGEALTVGPTKVQGIKVSRTDTALEGTRTLRSLIKLQNPTGKKVSRTVVWDSALGSDSSTGIRGSSSGDHKLSVADRWVATSDSDVTPNDPALTFAFFGKGSGVLGLNSVIGIPGDDADCVTVGFPVKVGANQTRYLLFLTTMSATNAEAIDAGHAYDKKSPGAALTGVSSSVQKKVLNWDLG